MEKIDPQDIGFDRNLHTGSLTESVYASLHKRINDGVWPTNALLPKEDELASALNVSRTVVREALSRLRNDGLIESKRGTGSRIVPKPKASIFEAAHPHSITDLQNCYEFRLGLEPQAAYLAALRKDASAMHRIDEAHAAMKACIRTDSLGADEDMAFHGAIAAATSNDYYAKTIAAIAKPVEIGLTIAKALSNAPAMERLTPTMREHDVIIEAIRSGDGDRARKSMAEHIEASRKRVFVGLK